MPTAPKPFTGRNLLGKLLAEMKLTPGGVQIKVNDKELIMF